MLFEYRERSLTHIPLLYIIYTCTRRNFICVPTI